KCIITECNPACSNIFATERKQIINKDITDYFNLQDKRKEELLDIFTKYLKISVEKKLVSSFEWEFVSNDGNKVIVFVQAKLFSEGESPQFVLFLVDITNEKKYQQELIELNANLERKVEERTEELNKALKYLEDANYELKSLNEQMAEESRKLAELNEKLIRSEEELIKTNAAKDKFISILAHDLRNPIAGIRLLLDTIHQILQSKEIANEATIEMLKKQVQLARSATNQTFELLENLLQWANLQRKGFDYSPELNNIFFFVDKCINIVKPNADNKGIKIVNEVNPNARGYFDEFVIQTIIRNLLMNAIKFSYEGSEIKVTLKDCEISDNCYTLSIQDRGVGMSEETIASI
ncbi:MAG TPA: PAS domain-containing sensor histidine kinase, partial [Candidatus Kapabacteria bacterium]|nr:PAS domain-containing sensor histidine kinase [Candidatus Kapabacteria bacterium]